MILASLKTGFSQMFRTKRMLFIYYGINLVFGLIVMLPARALVKSIAGSTLTGGRLAGNLDIEFILELIIQQHGAVAELFGLVAGAAILYLLVELFLSGGAFSVFAAGGSWDAGAFWSGSARHFGRFCRLALWYIPVFVLLYLIQYLIRIETSEAAIFWSRAIRVAIGYIALIISYMIFDYARILVVLTDEHAMRKAIWRGIKFTFRRFFRTFTLALAVFILGLALLFVYNPIADALHAPTVFAVLLMFLLQQIYMLIRMALKLTLYSGQTALYEKLRPAPEPHPAPATLQPEPVTV